MAPRSEDDASRAPKVVAPTIATTVVALILTLVRLYVRKYMIRMLSWDDLFNVLAMATTIVVLGLVLAAARYGLGRHFAELEIPRAVHCTKLLRICEFFLIFTTVFLKISISLFLKRLFLQNKKWQAFFWGFIAFNTITSVLDAAIIFPQCTPVEYNWNKSIDGGHCWSDTVINATGITQGCIAAATDFTLSILPVVFLWRIQLPRRVKAGICGLMALGFASGGFALARTVLVPSLTATKDPTWDLVDLFLWAVLEATSGVIAAAAPSVRPLLGHNSLSSNRSKSRSKSRFKSGSLPLSSMRRGGPSRPDGQGERERGSDGDSQSHLWSQDDRGIMKTVSIKVTSTGDARPSSAVDSEESQGWQV